jgi:hypothetical protein
MDNATIKRIEDEFDMLETKFLNTKPLLSPEERALLDAADVLYDDLGYGMKCPEGQAYIKARTEFLKTRQV